MTRQVSLTVNDVPIQLDYYVEEVVYHVVSALVRSLRDTGDIHDLVMKAGEGNVEITLNGEPVSLKEFPRLIIKSTLDGMVFHLKGVNGPVEKLTAIIKQ